MGYVAIGSSLWVLYKMAWRLYIASVYPLWALNASGYPHSCHTEFHVNDDSIALHWEQSQGAVGVYLVHGRSPWGGSGLRK